MYQAIVEYFTKWGYLTPKNHLRKLNENLSCMMVNSDRNKSENSDKFIKYSNDAENNDNNTMLELMNKQPKSLKIQRKNQKNHMNSNFFKEKHFQMNNNKRKYLEGQLSQGSSFKQQNDGYTGEKDIDKNFKLKSKQQDCCI